MKKIYKIEVDCANCAAKMEEAVKKLPGVTAAAVNYITQKMTVEYPEGVSVSTDAITKVCRRIDADFEILG